MGLCGAISARKQRREDERQQQQEPDLEPDVVPEPAHQARRIRGSTIRYAISISVETTTYAAAIAITHAISVLKSCRSTRVHE